MAPYDRDILDEYTEMRAPTKYPEVEAVLVLPAGGDSLRVEATASLEGRLELLPSHRDRATLRFF